MLRNCGLLISCWLVIVGLSGGCFAEEPAELVAEWLSRPILEPHQTLEETRRFAARRIPDVPVFPSAEEWTAFAETTRQNTLERVVFRGPSAEWQKAWTKVERLDTLEGGPDYTIQKLRIEVLPEMWIPALLYLPSTSSSNGKRPVFLNVNGHDVVGTAADYKQARCIHMARNGIIALNLEWFGMGQLATAGFSHARMNQLDLCGASGVAPFYLAMSRSIDFLLSLENADETRVGVAGLSGGGWQTIFISSLDTRVTLCNPVAGYSSFRTRIDNFTDLGDSEQTPVDLGITADYAHLTALLAPRAALLTYNEKDNCCFASGHALQPLVQAAGPVYELLGQKERFRTYINSDPGTHNFMLDNRQALYRMIRDQWYNGDEKAFPTIEQSVDKEIRTRDSLNVPLPSMNRDFQTLAMSLAEKLPVSAAPPADAAAIEEWRTSESERLRTVVKPFAGSVVAQEIAKTSKDDLTITQWKLRLGEDWTVPAVEFQKGDSSKVAMLISDEGRKSSTDQVNRLLAEGYRVLAIDPFYFGESAFAERAYLWALMVSTVGERPLGIQAGQILSVAKWIHETHKPASLIIVADGPRSSVIGLTARALNSALLKAVDEHRPMESLKLVIQRNMTFDQAPELFCSGLLEVTDIPQLRKLGGP